MCSCVWVCAHEFSCPRSQKWQTPPVSGVTGRLQAAEVGCWELNLSPLWEQYVHYLATNLTKYCRGCATTTGKSLFTAYRLALPNYYRLTIIPCLDYTIFKRLLSLPSTGIINNRLLKRNRKYLKWPSLFILNISFGIHWRFAISCYTHHFPFVF